MENAFRNLAVAIIVQALIDYYDGKLDSSWFKEQTLMDIDFAPLLMSLDIERDWPYEKRLIQRLRGIMFKGVGETLACLSFFFSSYTLPPGNS